MPTAREIDDNGFLTVRGCPISSFGIFDYGAGQLGLPGDPNRIVKVYRPESAVNEQAALDSFKNVPFIDDHEMLSGFQKDAGATAPEDYGVAGVLTSNVYYEAPWMRGDLKVFARDLQAALDSGKKDLSLGYSCEFEVKPGIWNGQAYEVIQTGLRGNHIALVDEGRVPGARVLDGLCFDHLRFDVRPSDKEVKMPKMTKDNAVAQLKALLPALQAFLSEEATEPAHQGETADPATMAAPVDAEPATEPGAEPAADPGAEPGVAPAEGGEGIQALVAQVKAVLTALEAMTNGASEGEPANAATTEDDVEGIQGTPAPKSGQDEGAPENNGTASPGPAAGKHEGAKDAQDAAVKRFYADAAAKTGLYNRLSKVVGAFDHARMDAAQVAAYGVKKLGLKVTAGQEGVALDAYLTGVEAAAKTTKQLVTKAADAKVAATSEVDAYINSKG